MKHYYKDTPQGRIFYGGAINIRNGSIINPSEDLLNKEGWIEFVPDPPSLYDNNDPIPEDIWLKHLFEKYPDSKNIVKLINKSIVYHYTTWDTLFKGILSSENLNNKRVVLRAYSVNYMNDVSEGLIIPRGKSDFEERKLAENYYQIVETNEGEKRKVPATMSAFRKYLFERSAHQAKQHLFSVSFSKVSDSLPMWNNYGHNGYGLSIGFDAEAIVNQGYDLVECIYDNELSKKLAGYMYDFVHDAPKRTHQTIELNTIGKNSHFEYEKECRIPLREYYGNYCITKRDQFYPIKYDIKRGVISPYVDIFVPLKAIQEIWIGPTNDSNLAEDSLKSWLESIGMNWIKIKKSSAPFR